MIFKRKLKVFNELDLRDYYYNTTPQKSLGVCSIYLGKRFLNLQKVEGEFLQFIKYLEVYQGCVKIDAERQIIVFGSSPEWSINIKPNKGNSSTIVLGAFKNGFKLFQISLYEDYENEPFIVKEGSLSYSITEHHGRRYFDIYNQLTKNEKIIMARADITKINAGEFNTKYLLTVAAPLYYSHPESYWL